VPNLEPKIYSWCGANWASGEFGWQKKFSGKIYKKLIRRWDSER